MSATAVQEAVTPWTQLALVKKELQRETGLEKALLEEVTALADSAERAKKQADAADPLKWSPERAKYFEAVTLLEAKQAEASLQISRCQAIVRRRDELLREIKKIEAQIGKAEREFTIARDEVEKVEGSIRTARGCRLADLEVTLSEKRKILEQKRAAVEAAWALRGVPVSGESAKPKGAIVPSLVDRFMAALPENREIELQVRRLEHEHDISRDRQKDIERELGVIDKKLDRWKPAGMVDAQGKPVDQREPLLSARGNGLRTQLYEEQKKFEKACADLEAARTRRDEMFAKFTAAAARK